MSNRKLGMLVALRDPKALVPIEKALSQGHGARCAAIELGINRETLRRWGAEWKAVGTLLERYTFSPSEIASLGGQTTVANRKAKR